MIIIWKGKGILVLLIFVITLFLHYQIFGEEGNNRVLQGYGPTTAFLITGISCLLLSSGWKAREGIVYYDAKKNREIIKRPGHSFFYINVYYWGFILTALGFLCLYNQLT